MPHFESPPASKADLQALAAELREQMQDAIAAQLDGSKPACFLSGGEHLQAGGHREVSATMKYAVVIEQARGNLSAYVPDLPGCVATGASLAEVETEIRSAIALHLQGLREDGLPIPAPTSTVEYIELAA